MTFRKHIARALRRFADHLDPDQAAPKSPGPHLLIRVRSAFVAQGTSLRQWATENGVKPQNARTSVAQLHPADIKAAIEKAGLTQASIAKELGVTPMAVWQVIHGRSHSRNIERRIANAIGRTPGSIWPQFYPKEAV